MCNAFESHIGHIWILVTNSPVFYPGLRFEVTSASICSTGHNDFRRIQNKSNIKLYLSGKNATC